MPKINGSQYVSNAALDRTFTLIEAAAIAGVRCPPNSHNKFSGRGVETVNNKAVALLAAQGRIKIEISASNWRRATLLTGPHAGKSTLADPAGHPPWKVVDHAGVRVVRERPPLRPAKAVLGTTIARPARGHQAPSAPRLLSKEELA